MKLTVFRLLASGLLLMYALAAHAEPPLNSIKLIHPVNLGFDFEEINQIKSRMQAAVDSGHIPGAMLLVGNDKGVGVLITAGTQGPDDDTPVNLDTLFRIYSMTKTVAAVTAMTLVEDGLLNLDDPVSKYIPEFADAKVLDEETGETRDALTEMKVEHLLTMQSGLIQDIFAGNTKLGEMYPENPNGGNNSPLEVARMLADLPLRFDPGTRWHYGHSTDVLGAVIEVAAGKSLDEVFQERIFDPLGMNDTSFYVPMSKAFRIAEPFHGEMADNTIVRSNLSAGGGLNSTLEDFVRFAHMLLNGGEYHSARIIEESTLEKMTEPYITDDVSREHFFYRNVGNWSLGFHLQPTDGTNPDGPHNFGWRGIGGTLYVVDPDNDFFMIYMEQKRGGPRGAPFSNTAAQQAVYEAMRD